MVEDIEIKFIDQKKFIMNTCRSITFPLLIIFLSFITGCKKETPQASPSYTLVVANAALGVKAQTNFANAGTVAYNGRGIYFAQTGQQITVSTPAAPTAYFFNQEPDYKTGLYSLFVHGDSTAPQTILIDDSNRPFVPNDKIYTSIDSVVYLRFINLSPNSVPLKIKVSTASTNEADALAYKEVTTWRAFKAAPAATTTYSIQIRNAATDALITTYSFAANATKRFKNVTLMIRGLMGTTTGVNAFGVTEINYF